MYRGLSQTKQDVRIHGHGNRTPSAAGGGGGTVQLQRTPPGQPAPPPLPDHVLVEHILPRVPAAATFRFRTVCRTWRDALTSDRFAEAHRAAARAAASATDTSEIVFFAPAPPSSANGTATAFYAGKPNLTAAQKKSAAPARELLTAANLPATLGLVMSGTRPCRGLTLLHSDLDASACHVINLSTGDHVSLPPVTPAPISFSYISTAGLGFDAAAREHKVVRLYHVGRNQPRCEVYGLNSSCGAGGGWRPAAGGQVPPHNAADYWYGNRGRRRPPPPVFVGGRFYWHVGARAILALDASTEAFGWASAPGRRPVRSVHRISELDGALCALVELDPILRRGGELELWTRAAAAGEPPPPWSLRCRISLYRLGWPVRHNMGGARSVLPIGTTSGGKILLATSCSEVYAYDPVRVKTERVFSVGEFVDYCLSGFDEMINISLHEDSVTSVRRGRPVAGGGGGGGGDGGQLEVRLGRSTLARREVFFGIISPQSLRMKQNNLNR
ncbi:unnamed protein product [Urochloa decumbens]|uniref:F-box domain-containing protein n=1 Tax=Urochloa decumbens TaxID=240449 RepID=A0ABC9EJH1_9POAL